MHSSATNCGTEIVVYILELLRVKPLSRIRGSTITNWHFFMVATMKYCSLGCTVYAGCGALVNTDVNEC